MSEHYYIDGYNLLHANPDWSAMADVDLEMARDMLIDRVSRWSARTGHPVCIFFDGKGRSHDRSDKDPRRPNVDIVYTSSRLSADALIERGVYEAPKRDTVIVVTSDRGISDFCLGLGALTMRAPNYLSLLQDGGPPARLPCSADSTAPLEDRIDPQASDALRKLRDRLESESGR